MARHPTERHSQVLRSRGAESKAVRVELEPAEAAALIQFAERGYKMLAAIDQVRSSGAIDAAISKLRSAIDQR
jgi:hypothetical protein